MSIAYIILAHKNPDQTARLVRRLSGPRTGVFVHIDKKADIAPFKRACPKETFWVKREESEWGGYGLVQAALNALPPILQSPEKFERAVLLSGQCYPIKPVSAIPQLYEKDKSHIKFRDVPDFHEWPQTGGMDRLEKYHFKFLGKRRYYPSGHKIDALCKWVLKLPRKLPLRPYHGSQWWSLTREAVEYVLWYVKHHPQYVRFQRHTLIPDEMFFQTILVNRGTQNLHVDPLRYDNWQLWNHNGPELLKDEDFEKLKSSPALFARKFDTTVNTSLLDRIDKELLV